MPLHGWNLYGVLRLKLACMRVCADRNQGGVGDLAYPLVSDLKREITQKYNVLTADGVALRGLFIIDKEVRSSATPASHHCRGLCLSLRMQGGGHHSAMQIVCGRFTTYALYSTVFASGAVP